MTSLRRWWTWKYKLPPTSDAFLAYTFEDLYIEFLEDFFARNPSKAREAMQKFGGEFTIETGDPLIDKWERQIARGETPDLDEGLAPEDLEKQKDRAKRRREMGGFVDPREFGGGSQMTPTLSDDVFPDMGPDSYTEDMQALSDALSGSNG